jgi:hypothetical protein
MKQYFIFAGAIIIAFFAGRLTKCCPEVATTPPIVRTDTVFRRDTIVIKQKEPVAQYVIRTDTIRVKQTHTDTVYVEVEIPIERKVYKTDDYRAEIEGFRPNLVSIEIYPLTKYITNERLIEVPDRKRWGIGVNAGYGAMLQQGAVKAYPYVGVGVQYNIIRW